MFQKVGIQWQVKHALGCVRSVLFRQLCVRQTRGTDGSGKAGA